jgi:amidase
MMDLPFRSAKQLAAAIRQRKISSLELLNLYIARVERFNPRLNAVVVTDYAGARKRAKAQDAALRRGKASGPLHGLPMTVKESYDVAGMPTTWGIPALKSNVVAQNAVTVNRFLDAGAVLFGKTNVPLNLADFQSYNDIYGTTNNPWDLTRGPGGSSGGSAAALAAGLTGLEAGSDIGSSLRNPAHFCGVYAHKPTYGIVTTQGQRLGRAAASDISVIGPMGRSADDLALGMEVMAGPDAIDGMGWQLRLPPPQKKQLRQYKVAVLLSDPLSEVDQEVQAQLQQLVEFLAKRKVRIDDKARPVDSAESQRAYLRLLRSAMARGMDDDAYARQVDRVRNADPGDRSSEVEMARDMTTSHRDWLAANEARHQLRLKWASFFKDFDLVLCPVLAVAAFPHNHDKDTFGRTLRINGKSVSYWDQLFWAGYAGVVYLPATAAPIGLTPGGLPVGVQIIGPQYGDRTCIEFARLLEREYHGFVPPPGYE